MIENIITLIKRICGQLNELTTSLWLVIILFVVIVFHFLGIGNLWPFTTRGNIYVDSPEVYTRERLVNDRYNQDFWLHQQLDNLDKPQNLVTGEIAESTSLGISNGADIPAMQIKNTSTPSGSQQENSQPLTFAQAFEIKAGIRDAIRQLVLENMLDDRHDLTGNSVYGLKFDTTVIPGANTKDRAFVRINLSVEDPFQIELNQYKKTLADDNLNKLIDSYQQLSKHIIVYYVQKYIEQTNDEITPKSPLYAADQQYKAWLKSVEDRLNTYMHRKIRSDEYNKQCEMYDKDKKFDQFLQEMIRDNLGHVLSTANDVKIKNNIEISLPEQWSNFMQIFYDMEEKSCKTQPIFEVREKWDHINVFDKQDWPPGKFYYADSTPNDPNKCDNLYFIKYKTKRYNLADIPFPHLKSCSMEELVNLLPSVTKETLAYLPNDLFIAFTDEVSKLKAKCNNQNDHSSCEKKEASKRRELVIPSGLFNFIDKLVARDLYTYAVFPKNEVAGILSNSSVDLAVTGEIDGASWLSFWKDMRESRLQSMSVGFGDGSKGNLNDQDVSDNNPSISVKENKKDNIEFGWVLSGLGKMEPTQKTELALISVPAWTNKLNLKITTGWLDHNAKENAEKPFDMKVPVPPDYQAFDSLIIEGQHQRKPKILNDLMDANLRVTICKNAKILIPGSRLWRSATVTLGAQKADRITVLPNMEGIIAEFLQVEVPHSGDVKKPKVKLQVWTSEGVDTAEQQVEIQLRPDNVQSCDNADKS